MKEILVDVTNEIKSTSELKSGFDYILVHEFEGRKSGKMKIYLFQWDDETYTTMRGSMRELFQVELVRVRNPRPIIPETSGDVARGAVVVKVASEIMDRFTVKFQESKEVFVEVSLLLGFTDSVAYRVIGDVPLEANV